MARWIFKDVSEEESERLAREYGISKLAAQIILRRGIKNVEDFLFPSHALVHSPNLLSDMKRATDVLLEAWKKKEMVLIHGDYDVDGITGASLLYSFMKKMGWKVDIYIPDRFDEGYGVSQRALEDFARRGGKVLLTVDCGITAVEEVKKAKEMGLRVVITDHHEVGEKLPEADAVVDPKKPGDRYPFKDLAGVGVAFKLVQALADRFGMDLEDLKDYLDLVALGTIADMVTLCDENRYYVKEGLKMLGKVKERPGLRKLLERLGISKVSSRDVSYKIAPRLNAAGRMGEVMDALRLLVVRDEREADELVKKLLNHNLVRQEVENVIFKEAVEKVEREGLHRSSVIVVGGENWHIGVIGIVASRLASRYGKPAMVVSFSNGIGKGSARSVDGMNIYELFIDLRDHFIEFGGHQMAVGFTIERKEFEKIKESLKTIQLNTPEPMVEIDAVIEPEDVNPELFDLIEMFEPFGLGNPPLKFLIKDLEIKKLIFFDDGSSAVLTLRKRKRNLNALWIGVDGDSSTMMRQGAVKMDVVCEIEPDFLSPKLKILDAKFRSGIEEIDSLLENKGKIRIDREELLRGKRINMVLKGAPDDIAVFTDIRTRNVVVLEYLNEAIFLFCCDVIRNHVLRSILRHVDDVERWRFRTISDYHGEGDFLVIVEPQLFSILRDLEEYKDFLEKIKGKRKLGVGSRLPEGVKSILREMGFRRMRARLKRHRVVVQDARGKDYSSASKKYAVIADNPFEIEGVQQRYSHELNKFQRASVVNLIKRGVVSRFSSTPSTDGLPVFLKSGEVIFKSPPETLYELLDAVYPNLDEESLILVLNYDSHKTLKGLDGIYQERTMGDVDDARKLLKKLQDPHEMI